MAARAKMKVLIRALQNSEKLPPVENFESTPLHLAMAQKWPVVTLF
jgi:hypothetical protein